MLTKIILILFALFYGPFLYGFQYSNDSIQKSHTLVVKQGLISSTNGSVPFWMRGNNSQRFKNGEANFVYSNLFLNKDIGRTNNLNYFYGIEWSGIASDKEYGNLIQNYIGLSYSSFIFTVGQKEEFFGYNPALGFGNLVNGNNSRPIPKLSLQTRDWFPLISSFLSVKGYIAHGWLEADRYQSGALLHEKYLHFKFNTESLPIQFNFGITHNAQWGGQNRENNLRQPTGFSNFMRILLASKGGRNALDTDKINALGNHLGTWDLLLKINISENWTIESYIQWLWEDGSGLKPKNWNAGVYGFSINQIDELGSLNKLGVEIVNTSNQGGSLSGLGAGPDNFLNNSVYRNGWTYNSQLIGSPIFLIINPENTLSNTINNVITGLSFYSQGHIRNFKYTLSFRQFVNFGRKHIPLNTALELSSVALNTSINIKKNNLLIGTEYNWSNYAPPHIGFRVEFQKEIMLRKR
ncbi:capsule assembly Wzi family protein [Roseivirga sp.]|uniref:capsule assembly Wzi family protein n=1 Tax=Roseivirga sp. TaxID=1964215 RepID=UPI002B265007|nr:capsule assembly Wzi family protein [Roseivirga sp.]